MAKQLNVTAKNGKEEGSPSGTVVITVPENLDEAISMYGKEAILSNALANWVITLQSAIRRYLKSGVKAEELQAKFKDAKMGVAMERIAGDPIAAFKAKFASATPEEKAKMLKELQGLAAAK